MTALPAAPPRRAPGLIRRGSGRRLLPVALDLVLAAAICLVGFRYATGPLQRLEALGVAQVLSWIHPGQVSSVVPGHVLLFPEHGGIIDAVVTASCSSILSVLGLTALTAVVLRGRRLHAVGGLLFAVAVLLVLNHVRLLLSALAGMWWGDGALVLFHDWVGTLWNLAATLGGFLLMVWVTLPTLDRAEQDVDGRHTADRPDSWARPGLGYRAPEGEARQARRRATLTGLLYRHVYPARVSRRLAAHRESGRIDYRIGHLPAPVRMARIRDLAADGLGAHSASLVAVATYDEDPLVLDCLARAVAARQWEPVTHQRVAALRLWARGWLLARGPDDDEPAGGDDGTGRSAPRGGDTARVAAVARMAVPLPPPPPPPPGGRHSRASPRQLSFARPTAPPRPEEMPR